MRYLGHSFDVERDQIRIADGFGVDRFGLLGDGGGDRLRGWLDEVEP